MSARLIAEQGTLAGLSLHLDKGNEWIIGRDPETASLVIEDPMVSRRQARCFTKDDAIFIENLSETNPTLVNEEPIKEPHQLRAGDAVLFGHQAFLFYPETTAHLLDEPSEEKPPFEETAHDTIFEDEKLVSEDLPFQSIQLIETGRWLLKVIGGPNSGAEFSMQPENEYVIGMDPEVCDIVFQDTSVSRQHAKIFIEKDHLCWIEDLGSRNGTLIEGRKITKKEPLPTNAILALGTTLFVVYDREAEMQTIISPLLPSIVKVLQAEKKEKEGKGKEKQQEEETKPKQTHIGTFLLIGGLTTLFVITSIGVVNLFRTAETVETKEAVNPNEQIREALKEFPKVSFNYSDATGSVLLVGHVLTDNDRNQLLYNLQELPFVRRIDDKALVIDEFVWREINQLLANNEKWKGIAIHTPAPGKFVMTGYLKTRKDAESLYNYLSINFPYLELLDRKIIIEQVIVEGIHLQLQKAGITDVKVDMNNGDVTFTGTIPSDQVPLFNTVVDSTNKKDGVRTVRSYVTEARPRKGIANISDEYEVGGQTKLSGGRISIVVNGKFISVGDVLDGRQVVQITQNRIILEDSAGQLYQIDY